MRRTGGGGNDPRPHRKSLSFPGKQRFLPSNPTSSTTYPGLARGEAGRGAAEAEAPAWARERQDRLPAYRPAPTLLVPGEEGCFSVPLGNQALHLWRRSCRLAGRGGGDVREGRALFPLLPSLRALPCCHMPRHRRLCTRSLPRQSGLGLAAFSVSSPARPASSSSSRQEVRRGSFTRNEKWASALHGPPPPLPSPSRPSSNRSSAHLFAAASGAAATGPEPLLPPPPCRGFSAPQLFNAASAYARAASACAGPPTASAS